MAITIPPPNFGSSDIPRVLVQGEAGKRILGIACGPEVMGLGNTENETVEITAPVEMIENARDGFRFRLDANFSGDAEAFEALLAQRGGTSE